jgi:hypothetical protein
LGIDFAGAATGILDKMHQAINETVTKQFEAYKKEDLLSEGDTVGSLREQYLGNFSIPRNTEELLSFPFYRWHSSLSGALVQFTGEQKDVTTKEKLDLLLETLIWRMAPKDRKGYEKYFWILHTAQKAGSKVVGVDNAEAKAKIIKLIKEKNQRECKGEEGFGPKDKEVQSEMAKIRRETMAEAISAKTRGGASAIVIVGSRHMDGHDQENIMPLEAHGIKYTAIKQNVREKGFIDSVTDEAEHQARLTKDRP